MKLFFLFLLLIVCMYFSSFKLNIEDFIITNNKKICNKNYKIKIQFWILGKIKILSINLNNEKFKQKYSNKVLEKIDLRELIKGADFKQIRRLYGNIEKFSFYGKIGMSDVILTENIIVLLSSLISMCIPRRMKKINKKTFKFVVLPSYESNIDYYIKINSILTIKNANIIYIIRKIKEGKNGTSNRKSYEYRYEQY